MRIQKDEKLRKYPAESMFNAYFGVTQDGMSIKRAARQFNVPERTLGVRISGKTPLEKDGVFYSSSLFTYDEEKQLVSFFNERALHDKGCTRKEVIEVANAFAMHLDKLTKDEPLCERWFYGFMSRNVDLQLAKSTSHSFNQQGIKQRPISCNRKKEVAEYFDKLYSILESYRLIFSPQRIFCIYEVRLASSKLKNPNNKVTTLIGCGNAIGNHLPPYFVLPESDFCESFIEKGSLGTQGSVSENGWSDGNTFFSYLKDHFLKYAYHPQNESLLIIYDGAKSIINTDVIDLAKQHKIELMKLPENTSFALHPLDEICFRHIYYKFNQCKKRLLKKKPNPNKHLGIDDICRISSREYLRFMKPHILHEGFKKTGIFPFKGMEAIDSLLFYSPPAQKVKKKYVKCELDLHENEENCDRNGTDTLMNENVQEEKYCLENKKNTFTTENTITDSQCHCINLKNDEEIPKYNDTQSLNDHQQPINENCDDRKVLQQMYANENNEKELQKSKVLSKGNQKRKAKKNVENISGKKKGKFIE